MGNKKRIILITGGAGYIGSYLIRDIAKDESFKGWTVRIYDNLIRNNYSALLDMPKETNYDFIEGDILDQMNLKRSMQDVDTVVHLGAIVRTPLAFDNPTWLKQVNHWGTATVTEAAIEAGVKRLIFMSSASVYGPGKNFTEKSECRPVGPYSMSKFHAENEVQNAISRGLKASILRLGSTYGTAPAMRFDIFVNRFVYLLGIKRQLPIYGSGNQVRPLIHIQDVSNAILFCIKEPRTIGQIFNIATENASVKEVLDILKSITTGFEIHRADQDILTELSFMVNSQKIYELGFRPSVDLRIGFNELLSHWHLKS